MSQPRTITAVCGLTTNPWPLLYTVTVMDPEHEAEVERMVAERRYDDLNIEDTGDTIDREKLDLILSELTIHFVLDGHVETIADFRA